MSSQKIDTNRMAGAASNLRRRRFLQSSFAGAAAVLAQPLLRSSVSAALAPLEMTNAGPGNIPRKPLGREGVQFSIFGLGGYPPGHS